MSDQKKEKVPFEIPVKEPPRETPPETDPGIGPAKDRPCEDVPKPLQK